MLGLFSVGLTGDMLRGLIAGLDRELDMLLNDEYAAIKRDELKRGKVKMKKMWHVCHFSNFPVSVNDLQISSIVNIISKINIISKSSNTLSMKLMWNQ